MFGAMTFAQTKGIRNNEKHSKNSVRPLSLGLNEHNLPHHIIKSTTMYLVNPIPSPTQLIACK